MRLIVAFAAATAAAAGLACGSSSGSGSTSPSPTPCSTTPNTTTIVIMANAVCPQAITVPRGSQVTFINQDSIAHEMYSNPHPEHTDCPEINQVGHLEPGQARQTGNLVIARTCGYHDHINFEIRSLQGTISIQ
jgi:plastocyanin